MGYRVVLGTSSNFSVCPQLQVSFTLLIAKEMYTSCAVKSGNHEDPLSL